MSPFNAYLGWIKRELFGMFDTSEVCMAREVYLTLKEDLVEFGGKTDPNQTRLLEKSKKKGQGLSDHHSGDLRKSKRQEKK